MIDALADTFLKNSRKVGLAGKVVDMVCNTNFIL